MVTNIKQDAIKLHRSDIICSLHSRDFRSEVNHYNLLVFITLLKIKHIENTFSIAHKTEEFSFRAFARFSPTQQPFRLQTK